MGSRVIFSRAPRGDATQAPPPVGSSSQLGTSDRAAREDHTHEGVHKLVAGSGIAVDPASGIGDVTVETLHWRPPVATTADLPTTGNQDGDARVVLDESAIYIWSAAVGAWQKVSGGTSGGGGSGGFVLDERLNHLRGQIRVSQLHSASRFELYTEFVDDFNDDYGIDTSASVGYTVTASRLEVSGNNDWVQKAPPNLPSKRWYGAIAFDSRRGVVVLFGGTTGGTSYLNDTWEWDGTTWTQKMPSTSPPARTQHDMVYDEARGVVLLFGGYYNGSYLGDTWIYDGNNWMKLSPSSSPSPRGLHRMVYDKDRGVVVLFGGVNSSSYLNDTWEWDGTTWIKRAPTQSPPSRALHGMVYDSARKVTVMFGGYNPTRLNDTWEYDGVTWTQRSPATSPDPRTGHGMVYDPTRNKTVLFGGYSSQGNFGDTWEYDGNTWVRVAPSKSPSPRDLHSMVWDGARNEVLLFGGFDRATATGLNDTWGYAKAGTATVILRPLPLPWVPLRAYLTALSAAGKFSVSRDGGTTWTPITKDGAAELSSQPSGTSLTVKIELTGGEYVDAIGVGASNI